MASPLFACRWLPFVAAILANPATGYTAPSKTWPDLTRPAAKMVGGGENDAAVVVGIETYAYIPPIPGALENAISWYDYFTRTRGTRPENVLLLRDLDATAEGIRDAATKASQRVGASGTLWFVFIGHGAPTPGGAGVLVGVDTQQKANSLEQRGVSQDAIAGILSAGKAARIVMLLDACFSGRSSSGQPLVAGLQPLVVTAAGPTQDKRVTILSAAQSDQFAGPLLGSSRPAFSYLLLGGLRGWADENRDGYITASEAHQYATRSLKSTVRDREQVPSIIGDASARLTRTSSEAAPDIIEIVKASGPSGGGVFQVAALPKEETAKLPKLIREERALEFTGVDIAQREAYDRVVVLDEDIAASPDDKAKAWKQFAKSYPSYAKAANARSTEWAQYAEQNRKAGEIHRMYAKAREADWDKLARLLRLKTVTDDEKKSWIGSFFDRYSVGWVNGHRDDVFKALKPELMEDLVVRYARACAKADLQRCTDVGYLYYFGAGVPKNADIAGRLFLRGCRENGVPAACRGVYYVHSDTNPNLTKDEAYVQTLMRLCLEDDPTLCNDLATMVEESDRPLANFFYERACDGGEAVGCTNIASAYREGTGVPKDIARSVQISIQACEMGSGHGCSAAAWAYSGGYGVKRDDRETLRYADLGCSMGDAQGCAYLTTLYAANPKLSPSEAHIKSVIQRTCELNASYCEKQ